jgi:signal transduction histidine kinase
MDEASVSGAGHAGFAGSAGGAGSASGPGPLSSEERLQRILSSAPVSIWEQDWSDVIRAVRAVEEAGTGDFEGWMEAHPEWVAEQLGRIRVISVNDHTREMFGAAHPDELTRGLEVIFSTEDTLPGFREQLLALHRGDTRFRTSMWLRTVEGRRIRVLMDLSFPTPGSASGWVVACLMDITQMHRADELVQKRNRELETLLHIASHDLREPLRAIETFSRMVLDRYQEGLDEKGQDFLDRVVRGARRMDLLLSDLLQVSRAQRMEGKETVVSGREVVLRALDPLRSTIREREAEVEVDEELPDLRVDPTWAARAVSNLVANALKFTPEGERPRVEIGGFGTPDEAGITVRDYGPGVRPEHRERIFLLFQRAVGREVPGTGAGLAIVTQVAEGHGGRAWVEDPPGGGARFTVTFGPPPSAPEGASPEEEESDER